MLRSLPYILVFIFLMSFSSYAQLAKGKCKFLGNIVSGSVPSDFNTYWNQVTPENAGKWGSVEATRNNMQWGGLDLAYNYAKSNNFLFKQHNFVWGQQQPDWMNGLTQEEQKQEVEEWIRLFCERYPNTDHIDVVNEPLHAVPSYFNALGGSGATGWDWVIWAFEKARAYCPNAKLILNDYNIINDNNATDRYLVIINLLKQRNLIDGIGEQGHFLETTPNATITANLNKLSATGIPIYISEYDVNLADDTQQRNKYQEQFPLLWGHQGVRGITLWGYKQGQIWRGDAYLVNSSGTPRPALTWLTTYIAGATGGSFCNPVTDVEGDLHDLEIFPNPVTNGKLTVQHQAGEFQLRIIDMQGRERKTLSVMNQSTITIDLEEPAGIYLLKIQTDKNTITKKIMIAK